MKIKENFFVKTTVIIVSMIFLILGAKVIRYTIMKSVLVDESSGHGMVDMINYNSNTMVSSEYQTEEELNAATRTVKIFKNPHISQTFKMITAAVTVMSRA